MYNFKCIILHFEAFSESDWWEENPSIGGQSHMYPYLIWKEHGFTKPDFKTNSIENLDGF